MSNSSIWEIAEAYLSGNMQSEEVAALKNRLETDTVFANEFNETTNLISSFEGSGRHKRFRAMLRSIQAQQATANTVKEARRIPFLPHAWRTAAVAASVAILSSAITVWSLNPSNKNTDSQYNKISRDLEHVKTLQAQQQAQQNQLIQKINTKPAPPPSYTGSGFALSNDGYFVTAYHVVNDGNGYGDSVYIQTNDGQYFKANMVTFDAETDVAILKVEKKGFRFGKGEVPYTFSTGKAALGSEIFTLGYPKDDINYNEGYISSKSGFEGNDMQYTLVLPAVHGQSGSPVIDGKGNVLGVLTAIGGHDEANTYAVSSKAITDLLREKMTDYKGFHLPKVNKLGSMSRDQRIEKMANYTVSVKVYKK